jgi:hypothetical protein
MKGTFGQGTLVHQAGTSFRERTLIRIGEPVIQFTREAKLEHGIPEEFQTLVMLRLAHLMGHGRMRQGQEQQFRLAEPVAQGSFQLFISFQTIENQQITREL